MQMHLGIHVHSYKKKVYTWAKLGTVVKAWRLQAATKFSFSTGLRHPLLGAVSVLIFSLKLWKTRLTG